MAKLVIGTNKQTVIPAIVRDFSPAYYIEKTVDANGKLVNGTNIINLNGVTDVGPGALAYAYYLTGFPANTSVDLSGLTTISGPVACSNMFNTCTGLTSVDLSGLTAITGAGACSHMFEYCSGLTNVDLSSLTTISGPNACSNMFYGCTGLTNVDLSSLTTISGTSSCEFMFVNCTGLITAKLNALNTITGIPAYSYAAIFNGCTSLESVELGGLTSSTFASGKGQLSGLFSIMTGSQATNGCTLHFPSNFDPSDPDHTFDASTLTGYPTFGGSASYIHVAFDLPATE